MDTTLFTTFDDNYGNDVTDDFVMRNAHRIQMIIDTAWELETAEEEIVQSQVSQMDAVKEWAEKECVHFGVHGCKRFHCLKILYSAIEKE